MTTPTPAEPALTADLHIDRKPTSEPLPAARRAALMADPGFGRVFTDHMVSIRWSAGRGWHSAELVPYQPLSIDPANMTLHYGQAIFEGLKAYRWADGSIATFRPWANARRFQASARRLAMPELPEETFLAAIEALVETDREWVPTREEESLYLRPFMFAMENGLGVRPAAEYLFLLIASPAGAYFSGGVQPVSVWLSKEYVRAAPGGTGAAKFAGNYAASLVAQAQAAEQGCDQVVWLDAKERRWIEEMGGMNLYFVYGGGTDGDPTPTIVTPELSGSLLAGVTRDSLLQVARDLGYRTEERRISVEEWQRGNADGTLTEVFACGTAAVITPVGSVKSAAASWTVGDGTAGDITMRLRRALTDIQTGRAEDTHAWMHRLVPPTTPTAS
ncbi:branched-chain amino acid aminotransferase [Allostreptomyces psammosilenae]|uniref:branched-chain-amino-acid transaminase n=1 Tax=Allostreptomyces psammosilenae TaxID=1892865 RepID=A0A852ZW00_9ACTN|nr:branched-chain amino acid aminotransferase [Allostreptomyces psammosilenae]NYI06556.1 branched-chain amino acid aminotransferase [Allostreptomyces psammosilenae]